MYDKLLIISETLLKMDMEELIEFLQIKLEQDFGYIDDVAIEALQTSILDLQKHKLQLPGHPLPDELPQKPFGLIMKPTSKVSFYLFPFIFRQIILFTELRNH